MRARVFLLSLWMLLVVYLPAELTHSPHLTLAPERAMERTVPAVASYSLTNKAKLKLVAFSKKKDTQ